jgi:hypothetical protein
MHEDAIAVRSNPTGRSLDGALRHPLVETVTVDCSTHFDQGAEERVDPDPMREVGVVGTILRISLDPSQV